jgi:hypothetical protein
MGIQFPLTQFGGGSGNVWTPRNTTIADAGSALVAGQLIVADTSGGSYTLILPASSTLNNGDSIRYVKITPDGFIISATPTAPDTIGGLGVPFGIGVFGMQVLFVLDKPNMNWLPLIMSPT